MSRGMLLGNTKRRLPVRSETDDCDFDRDFAACASTISVTTLGDANLLTRKILPVLHLIPFVLALGLNLGALQPRVRDAEGRCKGEEGCRSEP
jgi:hypothetical protein